MNYLELRTGYDPALWVSRVYHLVVRDNLGVIFPLPVPCQRHAVTAWPAGFLSAELALVSLMQDRTPVTGTTADRDEVFHYRAGNTVTEMKINECFIKAYLEGSVIPGGQMNFLQALPDSC